MIAQYIILSILLLIAIIFSGYAQHKVKSRFSSYSNIFAESGYTGAQVARMILDANGLYDIAVVQVKGDLTDNYNHRKKSVNLSSEVYNSSSVAAIGVATHEVGHALQYKHSYIPIKLRNILIPIANFTSNIFWPIVVLGLIFDSFVFMSGNIDLLFWISVTVFALPVIIHLLTLPAEYNASSRAKEILANTGILSEVELNGASEVLNAAALTYVANLITYVINFLRILVVLLSHRRD